MSKDKDSPLIIANDSVNIRDLPNVVMPKLTARDVQKIEAVVRDMQRTATPVTQTTARKSVEPKSG